VGKTTLATNLARAIQANDKRVLLVDSDPQGSARDWNAAGEGELVPVIGIDRPTLAKDIQAIRDNQDYIIIDGAPQLAELAVAAIKCADLIVIPVQPSPYDIWACEDLVDIINARQEITEGIPKAVFIISRAIKNTQLSNEIRDALSGYGLPIMENQTYQKTVYGKSAAVGSTVLDFQKGNEAELEIKNIAAEILELIHD
jgi:chromosome partitioning protein